MSSDEPAAMPVFDSLSFALLIPFAICFLLIFLVCCFADEIKDICRMPSPLPASYLIAEHSRPSRRSRRPRRLRGDEIQNLILSEEGRSRNVSESSNDQTAINMAASSSMSLNDRIIVTQIVPSTSNNTDVMSETTSNSTKCAGCGSQTLQLKPSCSTVNHLNCVLLKPAPHSVITSDKTDTISHFLRNLSMNNSVLTVPNSCANLSDCKGANTNTCDSSKSNTLTPKRTSIVRNTFAPYKLNKYLNPVLPTENTSQTSDACVTSTSMDNKSTLNESMEI